MACYIQGDSIVCTGGPKPRRPRIHSTRRLSYNRLLTIQSDEQGGKDDNSKGDKTAGTTKKTRKELAKLGLESSDYWMKGSS
jgi:hypothetical protein